MSEFSFTEVRCTCFDEKFSWRLNVVWSEIDFDGLGFMKIGREVQHARVENALLAIWKEILDVETVKRADSFFELGGNSLKAMYLFDRIREELESTITLKDIFANHRFEDMIESLCGDQPLADFDTGTL